MAPFFLRGFEPPVPEFTLPGRKIHKLKIPSRLLYPISGPGAIIPSPNLQIPARVSAGDTIGTRDGLSILAPIDGLVRLNGEGTCLMLRPEGNPGSAIREGGEFNQDSWNSLFGKGRDGSIFDRLGMESSDFPDISFGTLLESVRKHPKPVIILSSHDTQGGILWDELGVTDPVLRELGKALAPFIPGGEGRIHYYGRKEPFWIPSNLRAYGYHQPHMIARRVLGKKQDLDFATPLHEQGILFVGPGTAFSLIESVQSGKPATRKLVAVRYEKGLAGGKKDGETHLYWIPSGYPMLDFFEEITSGIPGARLVPENLFHFGPMEEIREDDAVKMSGSGLYYVFASVEKKRSSSPLPCSGCMLCDRICPSGASPMGIVSSAGFKPGSCIQCGLCDYVCPSNIPLARGRNP